MEKNNVCSMETFFKTENFESYNENVQEILKKLFNVLTSEGVKFVIKIGKGKNAILTVSLEEKTSANIATIYIHKEHIRIKCQEETKISSVVEISEYEDFIIDLLEKYHEMIQAKRQYSIYVNDEIIKKIENIAAEGNLKVNEIIERFLHEKTSGIFTSIRHRIEFVNLLKQSDMYRSEHMLHPKVLRRIAFMYLISANQKGYKFNYGEKFKINILGDEKFNLTGPIYIFENPEVNAIEALAECILRNYNFQDAISDISSDDDFSLAINALKIINGKYIVDLESKDVLVENKSKLMVNPSFKW